MAICCLGDQVLDRISLLTLYRPAHNVAALAPLTPKPPLNRWHVAAYAGADARRGQRAGIDHTAPPASCANDPKVKPMARVIANLVEAFGSHAVARTNAERFCKRALRLDAGITHLPSCLGNAREGVPYLQSSKSE